MTMNSQRHAVQQKVTVTTIVRVQIYSMYV